MTSSSYTAPPPPHVSFSTLSQQVFDETVLENEQVFDLTREEAVQETLDQYTKQQQQHQSASSSLFHLLWSHPLSSDGILERQKRQEFVQLLERFKTITTASTFATTTNGNSQLPPAPWVLQLYSTFQTMRSSSYRDWLGYLHLVQVHQGWDSIVSWWMLQSLPSLSSLSSLLVVGMDDDDTNSLPDDSMIILKIMLQILLPPPACSSSSSSRLSSKTTTAAAETDPWQHPPPPPSRDNVIALQASILLQWWLSTTTSSSTTTTTTAQQFCHQWLLWYDHVFHSYTAKREQATDSIDNNKQSSLLLDLLLQLGHVTCSLTKQQSRVLRLWMQPQHLTTTNNNHKTSLSILLPATLHHVATRLQDANSSGSSSSAMGHDTTNTLWERVILVCQWIIVLCQYHLPPAQEANDPTDGSCAHDHVLAFTKPRQAPPVTTPTTPPSSSLFEQRVVHPYDESPQHLFTTLLDLANVALHTLETTTTESTTTASLSSSSSALAYCFMTLRVLAMQDDLVQIMVSAQILPVIRRAMTTVMMIIAAGNETTTTSSSSSLNNISTTDAALTSHVTAEIPPNDKENDQIDDNCNSLSSSSRIQAILVASLGLLRNLCANDDMKAILMTESTSSSSWVSLLGQVMTHYPHQAKIQEHGCGLIAAMALRKPQHAFVLVEQYKCHDWLLAAMQHQPNSPTVQRQACLAIRNLASRANQVWSSSSSSFSSTTTTETTTIQQTMLVDTGLEDVLVRHAVPLCPEEAYAALRDLGCANADRYRPRQVQMFGDYKA